MTGEANQALELDELKALCVEAREHLRLDARVPTANLILRLVNALESLTAEVERLRAQRDEASALHAPMRVHTGSKTHGGEPEYGFICVLCRESHPCRTRRVLSRTEDGTDG